MININATQTQKRVVRIVTFLLAFLSFFIGLHFNPTFTLKAYVCIWLWVTTLYIPLALNCFYNYDRFSFSVAWNITIFLIFMVFFALYPAQTLDLVGAPILVSSFVYMAGLFCCLAKRCLEGKRAFGDCYL